jgi:hypothetical protein
MASTTENEINDFITEGGYDASEGPVTESANDIRDKKRKAKQDEHVSYPRSETHIQYSPANAIHRPLRSPRWSKRIAPST